MCFNTSYVSVQVSTANEKYNIIIVSIHPMCRFKLLMCNINSTRIYVSIHPMCRFKTERLVGLNTMSSFNTSYVSVQVFSYYSKFTTFSSFNTSYVSVQELKFFHLFVLLRCFNTSYVSVQENNDMRLLALDKFQYILCVGSREGNSGMNFMPLSFNTSYVSVQGWLTN